MATVGLLLDLIGALILIVYQFKIRAHVDDNLIIKDYGHGWHTQVKHVRQRKQTVVGFSILSAGFILQAVGGNAMMYEFMSKLNDPQILGLLVSFMGAFHISAAVFLMRYKDLRKTCYGDNQGMSEDLIRFIFRQSRKTFIGFVVFSVGILLQVVDYFIPDFAIPTIATILILILASALPSILVLYLLNDGKMKELEKKANEEALAQEQAKGIRTGV